MAPPVRYCIPGERLCNLEEGSPGSGTYIRHGCIFSSLAGCLMKSSENGTVKGAVSQLLRLCLSLKLRLFSLSGYCGGISKCISKLVSKFFPIAVPAAGHLATTDQLC